ncbi:YybH family protein [Rhizobium sp. G21]|uniref:YybH family protein n=1 Tax=Rhizobium sp. G21 TaxID=2758439 RepID=UPI001AEE24B7|nr:SgcJ/EcaC family oxidoreductase [Rhizobium sp. G21]
MKPSIRPSGEDAAASSARLEIEKALAQYEAALNASDTMAVAKMFVADAVFMAPNNPSAIGLDAIWKAYDGIFQTITFDTELTVEEVVQTAPEWAFVRTSSKGFVTVKATEQRVPDANHELFIFQRDASNQWKIARYSFATTNPLPH